MIKTRKISSIAARLPPNTDNTVYINVLTWHPASRANGSKYHVFSPYFLRTDGSEDQHNEGNILFENFWQGSKLWPTYYDCDIFAHKNLRGVEKHRWFKYTCANGLGSEKHVDDENVIQPEYYRWREAVFNCQKPIRYPNGFARASQVAFSLLIDKDGTETRLDYIAARKALYVKEYCRLIRNLPEFVELVDILLSGKTLIICEVDVPNNKTITIEFLEKLLEDKSIKFGHGLCMAWELLKAVKTPDLE